MFAAVSRWILLAYLENFIRKMIRIAGLSYRFSPLLIK